MKALAVVRADLRHGRTVVSELRGRVPLVPRSVSVPGDTPEVVFVGGAAGPIGGDELMVRVHVGAGARLRVRTAAAAVILLGDGTPARQTVELEVADGGALEWLPEPVVVAARARFHTVVRAVLGTDARLLIRETLVLGRSNEPCGDAVSRWDVVAAGRPVLRQQTAYGPGAHPGWRGPAGTAGGTVVATGLAFPSPPTRPPSVPGRSVCALAAGGTLTTVTARDALTASRAMDGISPAGPSPAEPGPTAPSPPAPSPPAPSRTEPLPAPPPSTEPPPPERAMTTGQTSSATSSEPAVPSSSTPLAPAGAAVR
ncbi:urease accessory protein UreD [Embleya sp. NBC_00896]|uniref:urease accessory protein UreD n=1 Tax=Embleya sp. NBC_00896 TaxID=2975961 RepID=UPI00386DC4EF|nr:urease accessory protein UreD [Embleya sp. NBC_00896]